MLFINSCTCDNTISGLFWFTTQRLNLINKYFYKLRGDDKTRFFCFENKSVMLIAALPLTRATFCTSTDKEFKWIYNETKQNFQIKIHAEKVKTFKYNWLLLN